ncbi:aldo-keto reductase [Glomus cerebriforme]|uniref:Aldo-keto reductase n=1 Tax=Glomus cerebriforme TaxID=658196 RepID=A0A397SQH3_9GLOM|nr:aldo-keto reductase [Glomus cerebriforme]
MADSAKLTLSSTTTLNDGCKIPLLGLGVYQAPKGVTTQNAVTWALEAGYRHIDTAALYENEADVGAAVNKSGIPREEIWITTKIWNSDQGYEKTLQAAERSIEKLQSEYIDLLILHSPLPGPQLRKESYDALQKLVRLGKVRSIGVSNYGVQHLKELLEQKPEIKPAVNQVEIHPWLARNDITTFCAQNDIVVEAYSPLTKGKKLNDPTLVQIAETYNKSSAQILIRWGLQHGYVTLPKSINKDRIIQNADVYNFEIDEEDMKVLDNLDEYLTTGWDPTKCE